MNTSNSKSNLLAKCDLSEIEKEIAWLIGEWRASYPKGPIDWDKIQALASSDLNKCINKHKRRKDFRDKYFVYLFERSKRTAFRALRDSVTEYFKNNNPGSTIRKERQEHPSQTQQKRVYRHNQRWRRASHRTIRKFFVPFVAADGRVKWPETHNFVGGKRQIAPLWKENHQSSQTSFHRSSDTENTPQRGRGSSLPIPYQELAGLWKGSELKYGGNPNWDEIEAQASPEITRLLQDKRKSVHFGTNPLELLVPVKHRSAFTLCKTRHDAASATATPPAPIRPEPHIAGIPSESTRKQYHEVGDLVYCQIDLFNNEWTKASVLSYTVEGEGCSDDPVRVYSLKCCGEVVDNIEEARVMSFHDYEFLLDPESSLSGVVPFCNPRSDDPYMRERGWYETEVTGDLQFASLVEAKAAWEKIAPKQNTRPKPTSPDSRASSESGSVGDISSESAKEVSTDAMEDSSENDESVSEEDPQFPHHHQLGGIHSQHSKEADDALTLGKDIPEQFTVSSFDKLCSKFVIRTLSPELRELAVLLEKAMYGSRNHWAYVDQHRSKALEFLMKSKAHLVSFHQGGKRLRCLIGETKSRCDAFDVYRDTVREALAASMGMTERLTARKQRSCPDPSGRDHLSPTDPIMPTLVREKGDFGSLRLVQKHHVATQTDHRPRKAAVQIQTVHSYLDEIRRYHMLSSGVRREAYLLLHLKQWQSWIGSEFAKVPTVVAQNVHVNLVQFREDERTLFEKVVATAHTMSESVMRVSNLYVSLRNKVWVWWCSQIQSCCRDFAAQWPRVWGDFEYSQRSLWDYFSRVETSLESVHCQQCLGLFHEQNSSEELFTLDAATQLSDNMRDYVFQLRNYYQSGRAVRKASFLSQNLTDWKRWMDGRENSRLFLTQQQFLLDRFCVDESSLVDQTVRNRVESREINLYMSLREKLLAWFSEVLRGSWKDCIDDSARQWEDFEKEQHRLWGYFNRIEQSTLNLHLSRCTQEEERGNINAGSSAAVAAV